MPAKILGYSTLNPGKWGNFGKLGYWYVNGSNKSNFKKSFPATLTSWDAPNWSEASLISGSYGSYNRCMDDENGVPLDYGFRSASLANGVYIDLAITGPMIISLLVTMFGTAVYNVDATVSWTGGSDTKTVAPPRYWPFVRFAIWGSDTISLNIKNPSYYPRLSGFLVDPLPMGFVGSGGVGNYVF